MKTIEVFGNVFNRSEYVETLETYIHNRNKMQSSVDIDFVEYARLIELAKSAEKIDINTYYMLDANEIDVLEIVESRMNNN